MYCTFSRGLIGATLLGLIAAGPLSADTILKVGLGQSSPDVAFELADGVGELGTQSDGLLTSLGDTQTNATFLNFVSEAGVANIPADASFSLSGISAKGAAVVFGGSLINQETSGGSFQLYDQSNTLILEGLLEDGILTGPIGGSDEDGPSTGSLFTVNLGTFILSEGADDEIFNLVDPNSAQLSMSFTNVASEDGAIGGLVIDGGILQPFTADVTAQIEANPRDPNLAPEPASLGLAMIGALAMLGIRRRR